MDYRLYSNRAACYLKLNDNEHCIQDASRVSVGYRTAKCYVDVYIITSILLKCIV